MVETLNISSCVFRNQRFMEKCRKIKVKPFSSINYNRVNFLQRKVTYIEIRALSFCDYTNLRSSK